MGVQVVTAWQIHPGRAADFVQICKEAKRIHDSMGSTASLISWGVAGASTNGANYILSFNDMEAWGEFSDGLAGHTEWQQWVAKNFTADGPGVVAGQAFLADLPGLDSAPLEPGNFVQAWTGRMAPGHTIAEFTKTLESTKTLSLKHGALWMNARRCIAGGDFVGTVVFTSGFSGAAHFAKSAADFMSDPATAEVFEQVSTRLVSQSVSYGRVVAL